MQVSPLHVVRQGPVIGALVRTARLAARSRRPGPRPAVELPGPLYEERVSARASALIADYLRWSGAVGRPWGDGLPPHLFPQWGFPVLSRTLAGVPYDLTRVVNAGCRMEINGPIDNDVLALSARLLAIDDDGRRAILVQELTTGSALRAEVRAFVPLAKGEGSKRDKPRVPPDARPLGRRRLGPDAGLEFALLTGDFNPVHWVPPYARAAGFPGAILHGFGTLALAMEAVNRNLFSGDGRRWRTVDVRFVRPIALPGEVGVFTTDRAPDGAEGAGLYVGTQPGGPAFLVGAFTHV